MELEGTTTGIVVGEGIDIHLTQFLSPISEELMQEATFVPCCPVGLSHFAKWGLEVIAHVGHVVVVGHSSGLCLCHRVFGVVGIRASMIHIVTGEVGTRAQLADGERFHFFATHVDASMIGGHHATPQFTGEVGVGEVFRLHLCVLVLAQGFCGDNR